MKQFITPTYIFSPGASGVGFVNLTGISEFNIKYLVSIINQTRGIIIYATGSPNYKYTNISGTTVTLFTDTSAMSSGDILQVIYEVQGVDLPTGAATSEKQDIGNASLVSLDEKIISMADVQSSSFLAGTSVIQKNVINFATLSFAVSGSWVGTIVTEVSLDAITWYPINFVDLSTGNTLNSLTENLVGQVDIVGVNYFRLRGATIVSGTAFISYVSSMATSLPTGSATFEKQDSQIIVLNEIKTNLNLTATEASLVAQTEIISSINSKLEAENIRQKILKSENRESYITYADFGTKNQRITKIEYLTSTIPTKTASKVITYTLVGNKYKTNSINWIITTN